MDKQKRERKQESITNRAGLKRAGLKRFILLKGSLRKPPPLWWGMNQTYLNKVKILSISPNN